MQFDPIIEQQPGKRRATTPDAIAALEAADWPGNVRELRHVIERADRRKCGETVSTE